MNTVYLLFSVQEVEEDFRRTGAFVDKDAFKVCSDKIHPWIDIPTLMPYLYRYGLVKGEDSLYYLGDRVAPSQRKAYLFNDLTNVPYGYHLLYMCIREAGESLGHQSAAMLLRENGRWLLVIMEPLTLYGPFSSGGQK